MRCESGRYVLLGHPDLAVAAVDRAGADVFPAVAVMRRIAQRHRR